MNPLQLRKELLIVESELNRAQLIGEWQAMTAVVQIFRARLKSVSKLASAVALLVAAVSAFRREQAAAQSAKSSWFEAALKGVKAAGSIWLAFRVPDPDRSK